MVLAWLGSEVAAWPFAARLLAYLAMLTVHAMACHVVVPLYHDLLRKLGIMSRDHDPPPTMDKVQLVGISVLSKVATLTPTAMVLAAYNPTPSSWSFMSTWGDLWDYLVPLLIFQVVVCFSWDTHFYTWHRACHMHPWMYRNIHKMHHDTTAMMSVYTSGYDDGLDSVIGGGLFGALATWVACCHLHSYWAYASVAHYMLIHNILGHSGARFQISDLAGWAHLLISPSHLPQACIGNSAVPMFHSGHHFNPTSNLAIYSTYYDDKYGTAKPAMPHHPLSLMLLDLAYFSLMLTVAQGLITRPFLATASAILLARLPYRVQAALVAPATAVLPRLRVWDWVRAAYRITYASKGSPGAFEADPTQRYIFCYHPQNIIARGAWYTFAGVGQQSPVAGLHRCRLAVGRLLMGLPVANQVFRAVGCCSSSWEELRALLMDRKVSTSVAITPDGFGQAKYLGAYSLVLNKRKGFVRLAHETGALLVPVLGLGEQLTIPGTWCWGSIIPKALSCHRVNPVHVVFGSPVAAQPGESVEATHQRYVAELLALGRKHGVMLDIVE